MFSVHRLCGFFKRLIEYDDFAGKPKGLQAKLHLSDGEIFAFPFSKLLRVFVKPLSHSLAVYIKNGCEVAQSVRLDKEPPVSIEILFPLVSNCHRLCSYVLLINGSYLKEIE